MELVLVIDQNRMKGEVAVQGSAQLFIMTALKKSETIQWFRVIYSKHFSYSDPICMYNSLSSDCLAET